MTATLPKKCTAIYEPTGNAGEYSPFAVNLYKGCGHGCAYCYVPGLTHQPRAEFDAGAVVRGPTTKMPDILERLEQDLQLCQEAGFREQVMMSFLTDPYHPGDTQPTRRAIEMMVAHDVGFCVLTKGALRAERDIDLFRPDRDAFACTMTSLDEAFSLKWERNAALPGERIQALQRFHHRGIFTWVSLEPTLDIEASLAIVRSTHRFVDLYKVGRANNVGEITRTSDWQGYTRRMINLLQEVGARHYIKADLQQFLPPSYPNPLRVPQHH